MLDRARGMKPAVGELRRLALRLLRTFDSTLTSAQVVDLRSCGGGLSRRIYEVSVAHAPGEGEPLRCYALLIPRQDAPPGVAERVQRELTMLEMLSTRDFSFAVPRVLAVESSLHGPIVLREFFRGRVLADALESAPGIEACRKVARLAAEIHAVGRLDGHCLQIERRSRADEMTSNRAKARIDQDPRLAEAASLLETLRFGQGEVVLVHGDLQPQNILLASDGAREDLALIDWEYAGFGDPAYDLAVATRAEDRPFGLERGLDLMLDEYRAAGGFDIERDAVCYYQLCLAAEWFWHARESEEPTESEDEALERIRRLIRR